MQRFFVEPYQIEEEAHRIHINGTDVNHIKNVLRMKCGEDVWISDGGDKEYHCQIEELGEDEVLLHILYAQEPEYELPNKLYLFQGLPKADKMELIIQKAVELGAFSIIPVETKRCVVKLDVKKAAKKVVRWQQIAESAAKQSKRMFEQIEPGQSIGIFIGPEGGFEEEEVAKALEAGAHAITLGRRILRTETAGLAILSVLMFQLENE